MVSNFFKAEQACKYTCILKVSIPLKMAMVVPAEQLLKKPYPKPSEDQYC